MLYYVSPHASHLDLTEIHIRHALDLLFTQITLRRFSHVSARNRNPASHRCCRVSINCEHILFPAPCNWRVGRSQLWIRTCAANICTRAPWSSRENVLWELEVEPSCAGERMYARGFPSRRHMEQKTITADRSVHAVIIPWWLSH